MLACAASRITRDRTERVTRAIHASPDWTRVHDHAWDHAVCPLVYRQVAAAVAGGADVPTDALQRLRTTAAAIAAVNLRLTSELFTLTSALTGAGIPVISYKGPSLAWRAYGDLSLRHYSDLDVLIRREDLGAAVSVMQGMGYGLRRPANSAETRATLRWGHDFAFAREPGLLVEVHWRFSNPMFGHAPSYDDVWRDAVWQDVAGRKLLTLSPVHELLVLAANASWHSWSQLSWVCDFAELANRVSELDAGGLMETARAAGCLRPVLLAFHLAHNLLDAPLPPPIAGEIGRHPQVPAATAVIRRRMEEGAQRDYESTRLQLALRERISEKVAFALRSFAPNPSDFSALRLPGSLFPLYYVLRPIRLALKYRPRMRLVSSGVRQVPEAVERDGGAGGA